MKRTITAVGSDQAASPRHVSAAADAAAIRRSLLPYEPVVDAIGNPTTEEEK
jgi:hypothetical protein